MAGGRDIIAGGRGIDAEARGISAGGRDISAEARGISAGGRDIDAGVREISAGVRDINAVVRDISAEAFSACQSKSVSALLRETSVLKGVSSVLKPTVLVSQKYQCLWFFSVSCSLCISQLI